MNAFTVIASEALSPLLFDSPHSWREWPAVGTPAVAPQAALLSSWDAWIDKLWAEAADGHAPVLAARFHRAWLDVNRARDDIDPEMLAGPWPETLNPRATTQRGMGLIRRYALPGVPMYDRALPVDEVRARIEQYYDPYHAELARLIDRAHARFGFAVHIDCHSMKSVGNAMNEDGGQRRPDMVVSDSEGRTADPFLVRWIAAGLEAAGYRVQVNHPYRGGEIVRRYGEPHAGRHSVQIEINRALYMDEQRFVRHEGYARLAASLRRFVHQLRLGLEAELRHRP